MKLFAYLTLLLLCYSCREPIKKGVVIGNNSYIDFYDLLDSVLITPLKMKEGFMIGEINKIKSTDSCYFLLDARKTNSLYAFDKAGEPVAKFGTIGRGPAEYLSIYDFDVDMQNQKVIILCHPSKVFITDLDLNIEKIIPLKIHAERIACYRDDLYCYSHDKRKLMTLNRENGEPAEIFSQHNIPNNHMSDIPIFHKIENDLYYCAIGSDVIYKIENGIPKEIMTIQYEGKRKERRILKSNKKLTPQQALSCSPPSLHVLFNMQNNLAMIYTYKALIRMCLADSSHQKTVRDGILVNRTGDTRMHGNKNALTTWLFIPNQKIPFDSTKVNIKLTAPLSADPEANPVLVKYVINGQMNTP